MLYFYYGENLYNLEEKLKIFKERYFDKFSSGLNFVDIDFSEEKVIKFKEATETYSMFEEKKLIFAREAFSLKDKDWEDLTNIISEGKINKSKDIVVVFFEKKRKEDLTKKSKKKFNYLEKNSKSEEFKELTGIRLLGWLKSQAKKRGGEISDDILREIITRVGANSLRLTKEIEKIILYKKNINKKDLDIFISGEIKTDIFKTVDALAKRDVSLAIRHLKNHWVAGDDPIALLGMFTYEIRVLLLIKEAIDKSRPAQSLGQRFKIHPYVIKKNLPMARNFSLEDMKLIYQGLARADLDIKTGVRDPQEALEDFILAIGR